MQGEVERTHALLEFIKEGARLVLVFEADNRVIRVADQRIMLATP